MAELKGTCECGHNGCFHREISRGIAMFGGGETQKACGVKGCECLRFTPKEA